MSPEEEDGLIRRLKTAIVEKRVSIVYPVDPKTGKEMVVLCEDEPFSVGMIRVVPLAQLDPLPIEPYITPGRGRPRFQWPDTN